MPPQIPPQNQVPVLPPGNQHPLMKVVLPILAVVIVAAVFLSWYLFQNSPAAQTGEAINPTGSIYLTLSPNGGNFSGIFKYSFAQGSLKKYFTDNNLSHITPVFLKSDPQTMIFSSNMSLNGNYKGKDVTQPQIFTFNNSTKKITQVGTSSVYFKRKPVYSETLQGIFYTGRTSNVSSGSSLLKLADWNIYFLKPTTGKEILVDNGTNHVLSPRGDYLLYTKVDGLYLADLVAKKTRKVWNIENGALAANMHLAINKTGDQLAWSSPAEGKIYLYSISSWNPFVMKQTSVIDETAFWPIFSPDGKYLACEEVDWDKADWAARPTNPRLVVFDLATGQKKMLIDLSTYILNRSSIDDWTQ